MDEQRPTARASIPTTAAAMSSRPHAASAGAPKPAAAPSRGPGLQLAAVARRWRVKPATAAQTLREAGVARLRRGRATYAWADVARLERARATRPAATSEPPTALLTTEDVAARCGVSARTVRRWIDRGELPAVRLSERLVRVEPADV